MLNADLLSPVNGARGHVVHGVVLVPTNGVSKQRFSRGIAEFIAQVL